MVFGLDCCNANRFFAHRLCEFLGRAGGGGNSMLLALLQPDIF